MDGLREKEYKKLLDIVEIAYTVPDMEEMLREVWEHLEDLVPITSAVYMPLKNNKIDVDNTVNYNCSHSQVKPYAEHYAEIDPANCPVTSIKPYSGQYAPIYPVYEAKRKNINIPLRNTDVVPASRLVNTEFYSDFLTKVPTFYIIGTYLGSQGDPIGGFGIHRPKKERDFNDREKRIMGILLPYISKAMHSRSMQEEGALSDHETGVIFIGKDGKLLRMNEEAREALKGIPPDKIPNPGISPMPAFFKSRTMLYRVRSVEMRFHTMEKMILLEPFPPSHDILSMFVPYNLSVRQVEVGKLVIRGLSNKEIALKLFITEQTVKEHLQNVFEKVGVHSRGELTAKVMGIPSSN